MRVVRVTKEGRRPSAETYPAQGSEKSAPNTIFIGEVLAQTVVNEGSRDLRLLEVTFKNGARNKLHTHTTDQILVFTEGDGIVATEREERNVRAGHVAFIPAGEPHWHGAQPGRDATHWSITGQAVTKIVGG
ncbi:MAG TPA: cupin domain-containing protein [Candidatus Limnocylindria bacterium]|nr:cupin domain-containing protein [Candidatus Limnocylindria bacterium]